MSKHLTGTAMTMVLLWFAPPAAHADVIYNVTLDTSALANNPSQGPFAVDFELNDGTFVGDGNNKAKISNFLLTGPGSSLGTANPLGFPPGSDVSGSLGSSSTLTITDAGSLGGFNDFNQEFTPGSSLSFTLDLTTTVSAPEQASPDQFSFTVYSNLNSINGPTTASLLTIAITGPNPVPTTTPGSLGNIPVPAPSVVLESVVPEPASLTLFAVALATLAAGWNWQRRRGVTSIHPAVPSI